MEQKKNIDQNKKTGYALYDFMTRDMGLSGVALRVYALIYSFTTAGSDCHGSIGYIAKRVDASYKSVQLSLKHLVERGYVTKRQEKPKKPSTYVAVTDVPITDVPITDVPITDYRLNDTKLPMSSVKTTDNNKDNNKDDNKEYNYLPTNYYISEKEELRPIAIGERTVRLTFHQYASLIRAIGVQPTVDYIRKLDRQITSHPERSYPNHYKTVITWAREDFRIDARGEEILES